MPHLRAKTTLPLASPHGSISLHGSRLEASGPAACRLLPTALCLLRVATRAQVCSHCSPSLTSSPCNLGFGPRGKTDVNAHVLRDTHPSVSYPHTHTHTLQRCAPSPALPLRAQLPAPRSCRPKEIGKPLVVEGQEHRSYYMTECTERISIDLYYRPSPPLVRRLQDRTANRLPVLPELPYLLYSCRHCPAMLRLNPPGA